MHKRTGNVRAKSLNFVRNFLAPVHKRANSAINSVVPTFTENHQVCHNCRFSGKCESEYVETFGGHQLVSSTNDNSREFKKAWNCTIAE